ncbi:MAG: 5'/3'-nucleotidase SurE [Ignavibacteria bacterium]|nr:5'/3'-nucleotidase SurE [Ignavibacteria bacterium]
MGNGTVEKKRAGRLRVLVANDDGIDASGLYALVQEVRKIADVTVVAPDKQQSAVGHAITMNYPLRVVPFRKNGEFFGHAVEGTPADAVKLGVKVLMESPPDLVLSGINHGSNTAVNILYSGTVSAATEGTILGIPSIAFSLTTYQDADFSYAAKFAARLAVTVAEHGLPEGTLLNVNIPAVTEGEIAGVRLTRQGNSRWEDKFDVRRDPANREYFWLTGRMMVTDSDDDTDQIAIRNKYVSVTPIHYELTDGDMLARMKEWGIEGLGKG